MYKSIFEQTAEWQSERLGKFTASEIHKLMQKGRAKDVYFGETAQSYIKERLAEIITQEPCVHLDGLAAIEHGNSYELEAATVFEREKDLKVEYFGKANPRFIPYPKAPEWAGGSPDGFIGEDGVIEIKAPYNSAHHISHLLITSPEDLKKEKPGYYGQIQFNLLCSGRTTGYFVSYDPRAVYHGYRLHVLEIPFDKDYCDELEERISEAIKLLQVYLDCIQTPINAN